MRDPHYFCRVTYYTPGGHRRTTSIRAIAPDPERAATVAKRRLVRDKRRHVAQIDDVEVIEICP
jgi:hypothetical protein